jgi:hypothetical protein
VLPLLLRLERAAKFILMALVGMAIGVLVGDSVMHLLPAAYGVHSHGVGV